MKRLGSTLALIWIVCATALAGTDGPRSVSVPAGELSDAVEALAKQCGVDVVYPSELLKGRKTQGVKGTLPPVDAFKRLLQGTSLVLREEGGALLITQGASAAQPANAQIAPAPAMEEMLVTGEQPGPALWKISSGDHVLWILAEVSPLPAKVKWRSKQFETLLATSQEVILEAPDVIRLNGLQADAQARARKLPRGETLKDVVSPDLYARYVVTKKIFARRVPTDDLRPIYAANSLYSGAVKSLGLAAFTASAQVLTLAQKAKVPLTVISTRGLEFADRLKHIENGSTEPCLERAVEMIEDGGSGVRRLANAWSVGNVDELRKLVPSYAALNESHHAGICMVALYGAEEPANEYIARRTAAWLSAADRALQANPSTMAVVPLAELFAPDGYLAELRARGHQIVEPR